MEKISELSALEAYYGMPAATSTIKVTPTLTPSYRRLIALSPFCVLATVGPEGLDCSPRGDFPGFVRIVDDARLMLPDRMGNNRIDSLRNVIRDSRVALLFMIPGAGNTLRVNGRAWLTADNGVRESFSVDGKTPRTVMIIDIVEVYFQCARAIMRAGLWDASQFIDAADLPSAGGMLSECSAGALGGADYDAAWPARAKQTMW